jgi:hypothetical protein
MFRFTTSLRPPLLRGFCKERVSERAKFGHFQRIWACMTPNASSMKHHPDYFAAANFAQALRRLFGQRMFCLPFGA